MLQRLDFLAALDVGRGKLPGVSLVCMSLLEVGFSQMVGRPEGFIRCQSIRKVLQSGHLSDVLTELFSSPLPWELQCRQRLGR